MKKTILFDLDGTLINSTISILKGFHAAFAAMNLNSPKDEEIVSLIGNPLDIMFARLGANESQIKDLIKAYKASYSNTFLDDIKLLPNVKESIELAYEFANLGVVTTKTTLFSKQALEHFDMLKYFKVVIGRDEVINPKPDAEPILLALKRLNLSKENAFMVGDTPIDIGAALNAKIIPVGVSSGYASEDELKAKCDNVFKDTFAAVKFIKEF